MEEQKARVRYILELLLRRGGMSAVKGTRTGSQLPLGRLSPLSLPAIKWPPEILF